MNQDELVAFMERTFAECVKTCRAKNHDYAQGGERAFANFELVERVTAGKITAIHGAFTRLTDKVARLGTAIGKDELRVSDESFDDTCKDAINYLVILMAIRKGEP